MSRSGEMSFVEIFVDADELVGEDEVTRRYPKGELAALLAEANPRRCATKRLPTAKKRTVRA